MSEEKRIVKQDGETNIANAAPAATETPAAPKAPAKKKKLLGPFIAFCIGAATWVYGIFTGLIDQIKTLYNASFGAATQTTSGSDFIIGGSTTAVGIESSALIIGILAVASLLVVLGLIVLFKRIIGNLRCK